MDAREAKKFCVSQLFDKGPTVFALRLTAREIGAYRSGKRPLEGLVNGIGLLPDEELGLFLERDDPRGSTVAEELARSVGRRIRPMVVGRFLAHPPVPRVAPHSSKQRRPVPGGVSVGHFRITAGTLGCKVRHVDGKSYILSNNHVLANSNQAARGDPIYQPGPHDGGTSRDQIAELWSWESLSTTATNLVDAALAGPVTSASVDDSILGIGRLTGTAAPLSGTDVKKSGRTTGVTQGRVDAVDSFVQVDYGPLGILSFDEQVVVAPTGTTAFSSGGDSGSIIVDNENRAVALLFAGSGTHTLANPIDRVASALKITSFA